MALYNLPWFAQRDFTMEIALNRRLFLVRARLNDRNDRYSLDFFTRSLEGIMFGTHVVTGVDMLLHMPDTYHPGGHLFVSGQEPTYDNLVAGTSLVVYDAAV